MQQTQQQEHYHVIGERLTGYAVVSDQTGCADYDLIESRMEALDICRLLNEGVGPEWEPIAKRLGLPY
jgi:hypothetical protein